MLRNIKKYFSIFILVSLIVPTFSLNTFGAEFNHIALMNFTNYIDGTASSGSPFILGSTGGGADFVSNQADGNRYFNMYNNSASNKLIYQYDFDTQGSSGTKVVNINYVYSVRLMVNNLQNSTDYCAFVLRNNGTKPSYAKTPPVANLLQVYGNGDIYCTNNAEKQKVGSGFNQGVWYNIKMFIDVPKGEYSLFLDDGSGLKRISDALTLAKADSGYVFPQVYYNRIQFEVNNGVGSNFNTQMAIDDLHIYTPDTLSLVGSTPMNNDTAAFPTKMVSMVFNNDIDIQKITSDNFVLTNATGGTSIVDKYEFDTMAKTLKAYLHDFLDVGTAYTLRLKDLPDISGNKLADTLISFSTIVPPSPAVMQTIPSNNTTDVFPSRKLSIVFNTRMNESMLNESNIKIANTSTNIPVQWSSSTYDEVGYKLEIASQLDLSATYKVDLIGIKDFYGNTLPNYSFGFVTASKDLTDNEVLQEILNNIVINDGKMIDNSITLPVRGQYDSYIKWSIPSNDYLNSNGVLMSQPKYKDGTKPVTLTATVTYANMQATRDYVVKIRPTPNVVRNGGFENGLNDWTSTAMKDGSPATLVSDETIAHSGSKACLVPLRGETYGRMRYLFREGELVANKKYYVSIWAKQNEPVGATSYSVYFYAPTINWFTASRPLTLTNNWQMLSMIATTDAMNTDNSPKSIIDDVFQVMDGNKFPMTYYIDDFVVQYAVPYNINVNGASQMPVPAKDSLVENYTFNILNQFGNSDEMSTEKVTWSLPNANIGVTVGATTGKLTVTKDATIGDIVTIRATNNTYNWLYTDYNVTLVGLGEMPPQAENIITTSTTALADKTGAIIGDVITGKYEYYDINDNAEGDSTYEWIGADSNDSVTGTVLASGHITSGQEVSYTVTAADINKIIKLVITPKTTVAPTVGIPTGSTGVIVRTVPEARNLKITGVPTAGNELVGHYTYFSPNGCAEDKTVNSTKVGWYSGDNLICTGSLYRVTGNEGTISFKVTPRCSVEPFEGKEESVSITIKQNGGTTVTSSGNVRNSGSTTTSPTTTPNTNIAFIDIENNWAKQEILQAVEMNLVKGNPDGTFAPDNNITRAEFVTMIARSLKLSEKEYAKAFNDVAKDEWYSGYLQAVLDESIISSDNVFRPNDLISRQEMTKIVIASYLNSTGKQMQNAEQKQFEDSADIADWAAPYINEASSIGIIKGVTDIRFAPNDNATRAQSTVIILRLLKILSGGK